MATRTVTSKDWMKPFRGKLRCAAYPEGATQSFKIGAPVILSSVSGQETSVITAAADPETRILGLAAEAATGTTGSMISIWIADSDAEFMGVIEDGAALLRTNVDTLYALVYDSTNTIWRVDTSDTSHDSVVVTSLIDDVGTVNGRVSFAFIPGVRAPYRG